jgi:hypothetical protein
MASPNAIHVNASANDTQGTSGNVRRPTGDAGDAPP